MIYSHPEFDHHHELHFHEDSDCGLRAIVAIHRAWDKPSVGGCRMRSYSSDDHALTDVLRLSRGMSYKSIMAGLDFGGAKAIIMGVPETSDRPAILRSMAEFLNRLGGRYITGIDVGISSQDVAYMSQHTKFTAGTGSLPPAELTALGVYSAIKTSVGHRFGSPDLAGLSLSVLGLGKVGFQIARMALADGAHVYGADIDTNVLNEAEQLGVIPIAVADAHRKPADIFVPCALGGILNADTIPELKCAIVTGAANNQLADFGDAALLAARKILYAPDYVANAGGLITLAMELNHENEAWARTKVADLSQTLTTIFHEAEDGNVSAAAERIARQRMSQMAQKRKFAA